MTNPNVYEIVTDAILEQLKNGAVPWRKPWTEVGAPRSLATGKLYRGMNVFLLAMANRTSPYWATFNQIAKRGGNVKGQHGTLIVYWQMQKFHDKDATGKPITKLVPLLRYYKVFNLDQVTGLELTEAEKRKIETVTLSDKESNAQAEEVIKGWTDGPKVRHDGLSGAYYIPMTDVIHLPKRATFTSASGYYNARFHEMGHATGHQSRLDRFTPAAFGSHTYGREELVAQMTAAFLSAEVGIFEDTAENDAAYLNAWIRTIQEDSRAVVVAAGAAQKAADLIMGRVKEEEKENA